MHGGPRFRDAVVIDDDVREEIAQLEPLAPLHNAPALRAIEEAQRVLPDVPHVAVFDTAFHATIPDEASTYAVPQQWRDWGVRRYGFHGLSVQWCAEQVRVSRLVVCHLGGGSSVTAVRDGRSVDTTMGFSPLEGVPMTTRSGSVDPGALLYLLRERGLDADVLEHELNFESGMKALAGGSGDMREVGGLALDVFTYRVAAAVAAMAAALNGLDALARTRVRTTRIPRHRARLGGERAGGARLHDLARRRRRARRPRAGRARRGTRRARATRLRRAMPATTPSRPVDPPGTGRGPRGVGEGRSASSDRRAHRWPRTAHDRASRRR